MKRVHISLLAPILFALFFSCTKVELPVVTTALVTAITPNSATGGGNITSDGGGTIKSKGVCWSTTPNPTIAKNKTDEGKGTGTFTSAITGLAPSTTYYVRAYATNKSGTSYGNEVVFSTSLADADGNVYTTIVIGNQVWMAENLRTTKYINGAAINHLPDDNDWYANSTGAYTWYNNDPSQKEIYGALYKWQAVANPAGLCPYGWHVPTDLEWNDLIAFLGGEMVAGSKLKEMGNSHWFNQNTDATNTSGFTALPGGSRSEYGVYANQGYYGYFWTSTSYNMGNAWGVSLSAYDGIATSLYANKGFGYSVRCIKDAP